MVSTLAGWVGNVGAAQTLLSMLLNGFLHKHSVDYYATNVIDICLIPPFRMLSKGKLNYGYGMFCKIDAGGDWRPDSGRPNGMRHGVTNLNIILIKQMVLFFEYIFINCSGIQLAKFTVQMQTMLGILFNF